MKNKISKFIIVLGLVLLIGFVSAVGCCERTTEGGICLNNEDNVCDTSGDFLSTPSYTCDEWPDVCETGWCFDEDTGFCGSGSPKAKCENDGKSWSREESPKCVRGCCYLYENTQFITEKTCEVYGGNFDPFAGEEECNYYTEEKGACLFEDGNCGYTTEELCLDSNVQGFLNGIDFKKGRFCSEFVEYEAQAHKICVPGENDVYFADDHYNQEGVAEECTNREEICDDSNGEAVCKSISCTDWNRDKRVDRESWCEFDGYVGNDSAYGRGFDVVGSEHCVLTCNQGTIGYKCSEKRDQVCVERIDHGISKAELRDNYWEDCYTATSVEECNLNPDCFTKKVDLGKQFNFDVCLPKYPPGGTQKFEDSGIAFALGCTAIYKRSGGVWGIGNTINCEENCGCRQEDLRDCNSVSVDHGECTDDMNVGTDRFDEDETEGFIERINNICVSLGDYGTYINYARDKTENIKIEGGGDGNYEWCQKQIAENSEWKERCLSAYGGFYNKDFSEALTKENHIGVNTPEKVLNTLSGNAPDAYSLNLLNYVDFWDFYNTEDYDYEESLEDNIDLHELTFTCLPWTPPAGGNNCEACNNGTFPCTQYRCESLGKACGIFNKATNKKICVDKVGCRNSDPAAPGIGLVSYVGQEYHYGYDQGSNKATITNLDGSPIGKYTEVNFRVRTSEIARCVISSDGSASVTELEANNNYDTEHYFTVKLNRDNRMIISVICEDVCGDNNEYNQFMIEIPVSPIPDNTVPEIKRFEPATGSFLVYGVTNSSLTVFLDMPAKCRYSKVPNVDYADMTSGMICNNNDPNAVNYKCMTFLTGLTEAQNNIYIRCNDTSGNINPADKVYTLKQTLEALEIESTSPENGEVVDVPISADAPFYLKVNTTGGVDGGKSNCSFKSVEWGWHDDFFLQTDALGHQYPFINLTSGEYNFELKCEDKVGNKAETTISFRIEQDKIAPKIISNSTSNGVFSFTTDEEASCFYRNDHCSIDFENENISRISWYYVTDHSFGSFDPRVNYYITCQDSPWHNPACYTIEATEKDDNKGPEVTRVYNEEGSLVLITDESARCSYTSTSCDFNIENGDYMEDSWSRRHEVYWDSGITYHIKCEDSWQNPKNSQSCLIVVKPSELV